MGYDTIYALQDREDDALVGIRSSALRLGSRVRAGVGVFYALAVAFWALAFWALRPDWVALAALAPDVALVPIGGGGLAAGVALALKSQGVRIVGAQVEGVDAMAREIGRAHV